jgi:hypothetical protein
MPYKLADQSGRPLGVFESLAAAKQAAPGVADWQTVQTQYRWTGWLPDPKPFTVPAFVITLDW